MLFKTPEMLSGNVDFGFSNKSKNHSRVHYALARADKEIIDETGEYILFLVGNDEFGSIYLYNKKA